MRFAVVVYASMVVTHIWITCGWHAGLQILPLALIAVTVAVTR